MGRRVRGKQAALTWTNSMDADARWKARVDVKRVFPSIGAAIRAEKRLGVSQDIPT